MTLLQALLNSKGTMAQFDHRELGGAGQWMPGGMTMVGDMFNHGLKAKVDGLCSELSQILAMQPFVPFPASFQSQSQRQGGGQQEGGHDVLDTGSVSLFVPETPGRASGQWWPAELGFPNGTGAQNQVRYAYFNQKRRLAVELNGHVTVYDTLDHEISGVSQQQGRGGSLTLTSQHGTVSVSTLPVVSVDGVQTKAPEPRVAPASEVSARQCPGNGPLRRNRAAGRIAQERHSLIGRIRSQEGGASLPVVSDCPDHRLSDMPVMGSSTDISKVQSVDQRMRLGMRCRLSPTADVPSHTSGAAVCPVADTF